MTTTTYTITDTSGRYLRATMREATADDVEHVLRTAADYLGVEGDIERLDGGDIVLGALVARPSRSTEDEVA